MGVVELGIMTDWRASAWKRVQVAAIATLGYPMIKALGHTLRWRVDGMHHLDAITGAGRQPVMAFWHGRILSATYFFRRLGIVVITSENFDGEWIAGIIERFGYGTARGSTSRGARKALLQLRRDMAAGRPTASSKSRRRISGATSSLARRPSSRAPARTSRQTSARRSTRRSIR